MSKPFTQTAPRLCFYSAGQIRDCEQRAMDSMGLSAELLMERAGSAAFALFKRQFPTAQHITVYCGSGNNAGDGYVFARLAKQAGYTVSVQAVNSPENLPAAAARAAGKALKAGLLFNTPGFTPEVIVDALFGTGFKAPLTEPFKSLIYEINQSKVPVLALDIPSGLNADTGAAEIAVRADKTLTFIAHKTGLYTADGPDLCGEIFCDDLGLSSCLDRLPPLASEWLSEPSLFPPRQKNTHKYDFGHVLIVGGNRGMPGAVHLAAHSALRCGAGLVTVALHPEYSGQALSGLPEVMVQGIRNATQLQALLKQADVCVTGPGLGTDAWAEALFEEVLRSELPLVVDGGALRLLAQKPHKRKNWILTPHPGEAGQLLHVSAHRVQADRFSALNALNQRYAGAIILKGSGTLVRSADKTYLCRQGNPGMACAGMGDLLCGVLAALIAQGMPLTEAAPAGVRLHAEAGDTAAGRYGQRGMLASDLLPFLQNRVNGL